MLLDIRQERIDRNWTPEYVAQQINVSIKTIYAIETGQRRPSYNILVKLEDLFGKTHRQLFTAVDDTSILSIKE